MDATRHTGIVNGKPLPYFVVDCEADGPAPGLYSMVSIGIVRCVHGDKPFFRGRFAPISERWIPEALAVSGITREQHLAYPDPAVETARMVDWLQAQSEAGQRPIFVSDNPAFDWQFFNYYCHRFVGANPCGHSARRIGDIYAGCVGSLRVPGRQWHKFRRSRHTHDPVDDARGNAEALLAIIDKYGLRT